jgi:hypothetical protein
VVLFDDTQDCTEPIFLILCSGELLWLQSQVNLGSNPDSVSFLLWELGLSLLIPGDSSFLICKARTGSAPAHQVY